MTAAELYEIVKDVPKAAWPPDLTFFERTSGRTLWMTIKDTMSVDDDHAALMFEASMIRWLIGQGHHAFEWNPGETDAVPVTLKLYDDLTVAAPLHGRGTDILCCLAAACKTIAVAGEVQRGE